MAQSNRGAWSKSAAGEVITTNEIAHSSMKIHKCDSISSLNFAANQNEGYLYVDLVRRGESSVKIPIRKDYDRALIEEIEG